MDEQQMTRIPLPGGSGRIPTGAMQFQDDWPGLFIRGDDAITLLSELRLLEQLLTEKCQKGLPWKLSEIRDLIQHDVRARKQSKD